MRAVEQIMGMPITIEVVAPEEQARPAIAAAFAYFRHIDEVFSTYKPTSEISQLNSGELDYEQLSAEVKSVLVACDDYRVKTDGFFNISHHGFIDPSGLVKGFSIAEAAKLLRATGLHNFFISAGGDVQTGGHNESGAPWTVGIQHPTERDKVAKTIQLTDGAIATSGTYERGTHIYSPETGKPVTEIISLSVVGDDIYDIDVMATAAFAMGLAGLEFLARRGYDAYMITAEMKVFATPGFVKRTQATA
jgi:thiamine biosynthesis lipoprotein